MKKILFYQYYLSSLFIVLFTISQNLIAGEVKLPKIIKSIPENGEIDVDVNIMEIIVKFDRPLYKKLRIKSYVREFSSKNAYWEDEYTLGIKISKKLKPFSRYKVQFEFEDFPDYSSDLTFYTGSSQEWKYNNYDNIIILYQDKDQDVASWLDKAKIDKALFDIANKFGIQSSYRVPILIYPSNSDFIKDTDYMGQGILFNKTTICINPEVIYHISGKKKDYENIFRAIKHEYTHFSARELTKNLSIPILIDEGLAEYIANCIPPFERNNYLGIGESLLKNTISNNTLLNWSILFRSDYEFFSQGPKETNINNLKLMSS